MKLSSFEAIAAVAIRARTAIDDEMTKPIPTYQPTTTLPLAATSPFPTFASTPVATSTYPAFAMDPTPKRNTPDWGDVDGYGCEWSELVDMRCPMYGDSHEGIMGVANDNCCYCAGTDVSQTYRAFFIFIYMRYFLMLIYRIMH